ncbi:MAG TPA: HEPN domain-containing protein [Ktedonobacteraceae bacterium]|jgi:HEPN domain-containing protein|nr:HEPN domain-containing protein [Ktedonobacteraceae bacterium]
MSQTYDSKGNDSASGNDDQDELERLLLEGVSLPEDIVETQPAQDIRTTPSQYGEDEEDEEEAPAGSDIQGAIGLFAEAAQDMATAGVELGLGRHFACVDFCNQAVEKSAQAVSLRRFGRRSMYDHDLRSLGALVGAPPDIQEEMAKLTPFHPEAFYAATPPEEADEVISAEQANSYVQSARRVVRWARNIVLGP